MEKTVTAENVFPSNVTNKLKQFCCVCHVDEGISIGCQVPCKIPHATRFGTSVASTIIKLVTDSRNLLSELRTKEIVLNCSS